eukprot:gene3013-3293_t
MSQGPPPALGSHGERRPRGLDKLGSNISKQQQQLVMQELCHAHRDDIYRAFKESNLQPWEFHSLLHR